MDKKVSFEQLQKVLNKLGYDALDLDTHNVLFRNPHRRLFITLPKRPAQAVVTPTDMLRVRKTLANDGVIREKDYDSLFLIKKGDRLLRADPETGRRIKVTAAASESDGLVVIKQDGTLVPCPIDQLQEDPERARSTLGNGR